MRFRISLVLGLLAGAAFLAAPAGTAGEKSKGLKIDGELTADDPKDETSPPNLKVRGHHFKVHPFKMTADTDCQTQGLTQNGMLVHNCSVLPGDSGAPVLTGAGKNVEIIGVQVGSAQWNGSQFGLAVPVTTIAPMLALPESELPRPQSDERRHSMGRLSGA